MATDAATTRRASSRIASQGSEKAAPTASSASKKRAEAPKASTAPAEKKAKSAEKITATEDAPAESSNGKAKSGLLKVGDALPSLTLQDEEGQDVDIAALKKVVIFTYPKANTGGCTKQACLYRDEYTEWKKLGFEVYGLSNDGTTSLKNWKTKQSFPYALLSDPKRELVGALTGSKSSTTRSHFVIGDDGRVKLSSVGVKPAESSPAALKFAQGI